ncbi:ComEA family DNA-binding protein [Granulicella cerasi]|uniref:ComEA family DNA-binding protein n=1 Tax=Granulicella cerasi TaxID=741063 RepID=A0ABW1ZBZ9_9BACT|nr:helix-hairpin-helix domain-containing protein [Granulicella cerasi]
MRARWVSVLLLGAAMASAQLSDGKLDLNTASPQQLAGLPGMGKEYVRRVIAGRPYTAKNQLVTRGVLPQQEYLRIADLVVAHRPKQPVEK